MKLQKIKKGREKPMKNLIKKYGISEEKLQEGIDLVAKNLGQICDVNVMLAVTELLAEGDIEKPRCTNLELESLIKEALKDYRGNNRVIVSTSTGGTIEVEDFDANSLIEENSELEDKNIELQQEIEELERKIEELEEEEE